MKRLPKAIYDTPEQIEARIRPHEREAMQLRPESREHREIMQDIAQLRVYADAKRWMAGSRRA